MFGKKKKKREGKSFILADLDRIKGFRMFGSNLHGAGTCFKQKKKTIRINSALHEVFEVLCHNVQSCYFLVSGIEEVTLIGDISNEDF